ncbi:hypothetical protein Tco_0185374 [Tanacetum coccineum]
MNTTQAQQKALDDALVTLADHLKFGKCNMRLKTDIKLKEATFQVVLDALALTPFYHAFLITADVSAIYMQEFSATVSVHKSSIRFTINKKKVSLDVDMFREILYIFYRHQQVLKWQRNWNGQDSSVPCSNPLGFKRFHSYLHEVSSPFKDLSDIGSPGVDGLPMMPEDPYAYVVATFQAPPSPDYVPGPEEPEQAPLSPEFVPEPPLRAAISPTTDSPGYIADSDLEEDPEEDPTDYPADGGDEEQAAKVSSQYWKPPIYYVDDDDDEEYSIQDKVIKSSVENLVPIPSESKDLTDYESECDMPVCDDSSSKNERLDDIEFAGELAPIDPIPSGIVEADLDPEEDIRLIEKLLNDDSSPHSLEELNSEIPDAIIESFSPSPIPVEDSDSLMEEIDIFLAPDDSIPPGIENDDYDSEGDVLFLEELLNDDSLSLPEYESFHVDFYNVPSSPRTPEKPPDDDVYFAIEPDTGVLTTKVVDDISTRELYVHVPNVLPTLPTLYPEFDTLLPFSSENEDKVFNPGILISKKEKSPHLLSHLGFKVFQLINDSKNPMMIYGGDIPILDVPYLHFYPP